MEPEYTIIYTDQHASGPQVVKQTLTRSKKEREEENPGEIVRYIVLKSNYSISLEHGSLDFS